MSYRTACQRTALVLGILFFTPLFGWAQWFEFCDDFGKCGACQRNPYEERIETERHDFTQSAVTVGRGVFQVEGGYTYFYKDSEGEIEQSHTGPELLLRYGVSEDIELRMRWNYVWQFIDVEPDESGAEDLRLAVKLQMTRQEEPGWKPTSALEVRSTVPTGAENYNTDSFQIGLDYIYMWEIYEGISVAGSTGFGTGGLGDFGLIPDEPASDRFVAYSQSAVLGLELSERNTMYAEWFGIFSDGLEDEFVLSTFNIGIDHYINNDVVVDVRVAKGLSEDADDMFFGIGGGCRF